jgi:transcriptional regulator with XRE-family HTH domain
VEGSLQQIVGLRLRAYRETQGLSQEAFADVLGMHRTYLGGIERGEHNLTLRSVERIAGRISLDPMALLTRESQPMQRANSET